MIDDFSPDLITLVDEDGLEHNFEILDVIEENDTQYYALIPSFENGEEALQDSGEYYILEAVEEDGEEQLAEVMDEELRNRLSKIFEERFDDMFYED
jgi:uncharacterized protein YrzB (UPF0473 family)